MTGSFALFSSIGGSFFFANSPASSSPATLLRVYIVHAYADGRLVWGLTDKKEILTRVNMPSSERLTIAVSVKKPGIVRDAGGLQRSVAKTLYYSFLYLKSSFKAQNYATELELKELNPELSEELTLNAILKIKRIEDEEEILLMGGVHGSS